MGLIGIFVGSPVGISVGFAVLGGVVGLTGTYVGSSVGISVGFVVIGGVVGSIGTYVGFWVSRCVGFLVLGAFVGLVFICVGFVFLGGVVGSTDIMVGVSVTTLVVCFGFSVFGECVLLLLTVVPLSLNLLASYFASVFVIAVLSLVYSDIIRIGQMLPLLLVELPNPKVFRLCNSHAVFLIQLSAEETRW